MKENVEIHLQHWELCVRHHREDLLHGHARPWNSALGITRICPRKIGILFLIKNIYLELLETGIVCAFFSC
jgi:hypothetical protein